MPVLGMYQPVPQQDAMNRIARQLDTLLAQQYLQFARTPVGITLPQLDHLLLDPRAGLPWAALWSPTALSDGFDSTPLIAPQPLVTCRTRDVELTTQLGNRLLAAMRRHHKPHSLFPHIHRLPRHPVVASGARCARAGV